jgi:hypothetical protein
VRDRNELATALTALVESKTRRIEMGRRAQRVVVEGQGASERNFELLLPLLEGVPACSVTADTAQCRHQPQTRIVNE